MIDKKDEEIKALQNEAEKTKIDLESHTCEIKVDEKIIEKLVDCEHISQIEGLKGKIEELEEGIFLKDAEIDKLKEELVDKNKSMKEIFRAKKKR